MHYWKSFALGASLSICVPSNAQPKRLMILVFDQMRPDYIERYDMKNFKRAKSLGINFANGQVGHLEATTVISHPVISNGRFPRNLPWGQHIMRDTRGLLGEKGLIYNPFKFSVEQWNMLVAKTTPETSIIARLKKAHSGPTFAIAQKKYAATNFGGPYIDHVISLGNVRFEKGFDGVHEPSGLRVPEYISKPAPNRFYIGGTSAWGSENEPYPFRGNSFVTGDDPQRPGGDAWVGDVVEKIMANDPDWSAILASFGTIDKVSHVLAEHDKPTTKPWAIRNGMTLKDATHKADLELGRILDRLDELNLAKETTILITADHGGQYNRNFHGSMLAGAAANNLQYGKGANIDRRKDPPKSLKPLTDTGLVEAGSFNTMLSFWTKPMSESQELDFRTKLAHTAGVAEAYRKSNKNQYVRIFRSQELKGRELAWAEANNARLLATLAGPGSPDYIGLLFDGHGYGIPGGHGGTQEKVQRVPYILISPNLGKRGIQSNALVRHVDINPIVGRTLGLAPHADLDGSDVAIMPHLTRAKRDTMTH